MQKKKAQALLAVLLVFALLGWAAVAVRKPEKSTAKEISILVASDLHYISPALTDNGPYFTRMVEQADGKDMLYIEQLTDAFVAQVIRRAPDALILSGDLSFNGAYQSHCDLAEKLNKIQQAGVQVLVLPGNHDVNSTMCAKFEGDSVSPAQMTMPSDFQEIYGAMGYARAISQDAESDSYLAAISPELWVLMLDTNSRTNNLCKQETLAWMEQSLKRAAEEGAAVLAVSHQNILVHNEAFRGGYQIQNADKISRLYQKYGVVANLSGHMHIQHYKKEGKLTEILTSALSVGANHFGVIRYSGGSFAYEAVPLEVSEWARENGLTNPDLLDFAAYSKRFFAASFREGMSNQMREAGASEEEIRLVRQASAEANYAYFSGSAADIVCDIPAAAALCRKYGGEVWAVYLENIDKELRENDFCGITLE